MITNESPTTFYHPILYIKKTSSWSAYEEASIGVSSCTVRNWASNDPEFAEACEKVKVAALYFFEKQLLSGISGRSKKNAALLIFALKTRFHEVYGQPKLEIEA